MSPKLKSDYHLSNAERATPLAEWARVAKAEHRVEGCLKRGKREAGLGDDQVQNWRGWHHQMTLALLALWFLAGEARRGKKAGAALTLPQARGGLVLIFRKACRCDTQAEVHADVRAGWSATNWRDFTRRVISRHR